MSGISCARSHSPASGSTFAAANSWNSAYRLLCSPVKNILFVRRLAGHKCRRRINGFEIFDVQVVHADLNAEFAFNERCELNRKQRVDQPGGKQVFIITNPVNIDGAIDETPDGFFDV